jgi:hypothetical protein
MARVAMRPAARLLAVKVYVTTALPVPLEGERVSHEALLRAVHWPNGT